MLEHHQTYEQLEEEIKDFHEDTTNAFQDIPEGAIIEVEIWLETIEPFKRIATKEEPKTKKDPLAIEGTALLKLRREEQVATR